MHVIAEAFGQSRSAEKDANGRVKPKRQRLDPVVIYNVRNSRAA